MLFNSLEFLVFLPIVFVLYWFVFRKREWQNLLIVTASYVFYGWWDWRFLFLIAFTSLCSFFSGVLIERIERGIRPPLTEDCSMKTQSPTQEGKLPQESSRATASMYSRKLVRPMWLGSKLGGILEDFRFVAPAEGDSVGRIRALESTTDSLYVVSDYKWSGFGMKFERFIIKGVDKETALQYFEH